MSKTCVYYKFLPNDLIFFIFLHLNFSISSIFLIPNASMMNKYIATNDAKFYERIDLLSAEGCIKLRVKRICEVACWSVKKQPLPKLCCRHLEEIRKIAYLINTINGWFWNFLIWESSFQSYRIDLRSVFCGWASVYFWNLK